MAHENVKKCYIKQLAHLAPIEIIVRSTYTCIYKAEVIELLQVTINQALSFRKGHNIAI